MYDQKCNFMLHCDTVGGLGEHMTWHLLHRWTNFNKVPFGGRVDTSNILVMKIILVLVSFQIILIYSVRIN